MNQSNSTQLLKQFPFKATLLMNASTIVLVAMMLLVYRVWAMPASVPLAGGPG